MKHLPDELFDSKQLKMGMRIETEHTSDLDEAKSIAKDHLMEIPDYYTRLSKMEKEAPESSLKKYLKK
jgi:hypothetical protein